VRSSTDRDPVAPELAALVSPPHTALLTQECQRGVIGDLAVLPALAAAAAPIVPRVAALAAGARRAGVRVVHCVATRRDDGAGASRNARLFAATRRSPVSLAPGSPATDVLPALAPAPSDLVVPRQHGLSPMHGTELDPILRNLGVTTVVAVGVSVNLALMNLVFDAVNGGYQAVVPRDAVAGLPAEYVDAVFRHTLGLVATVVTTDDLLEVWRTAPGAPAAGSPAGRA
jgi:nicotinamidase-related amidase